MERAASACTSYILERYGRSRHYIIICGRGNNGGDGLAIARMLRHASCTVDVHIIEYTENGSEDFLRNLELLRNIPGLTVHHIRDEQWQISADKNAIIIDAILGTGINKHAAGLIADTIKKINKSGLHTIAIDVPSGLPVDELMPKSWPAVEAAVTLTFQQPKLSFLMPESGPYVGEMKILDIGWDPAYVSGVDSPYYFLQDADISPLLLRREKFANKGTFGHSLLITGAYGKMGAAVLSSHACLCSGTGLLTAHIPKVGYGIIQTALPEAMVSIDRNDEHISALPALDAYTSIGIGPGIGRHADTAKVVKQLIQTTPCPLVIDADALNIISENKTWFGFLPSRTIITPHPKEFDRLTDKHTDSWQRLKSARTLAHKHSIIIVLKGAYTATIMPDRSVWFNSTGNPALAKGGTGDVLTGIITALVSRGYAPREAAIIGVYIHGLSADLAVTTIHPESLLASDVISHLSEAFRFLYEE